MTKLRAGDRCPCCGQPIDVNVPEPPESIAAILCEQPIDINVPEPMADILQSMPDAMNYERAWCLATGSRCILCGRSITTNSPERSAVLQNMPEAMECERTCGTCPVAVATAHDHLIVCPFAEARDGVGLRSPRSRCTMEVVE